MNDSNLESGVGLRAQDEILLQILIPGNTLTGQWSNSGLSMGSQISLTPNLFPPSFWVWERHVNPQEISWSLKPDKNSDMYVGVDSLGNLVMKPAEERTYITLDAGVGGGLVFLIVGTKDEYIGMTGDGKLIVTREFTEWNITMKEEMNPAQTAVRHDILIVKDNNSSRKWVVNSPVRGDDITLALDHQHSKGTQWLSKYHSNFMARDFRPIMDRALFITTDVKTGTVTLQPADAATESARMIRGSGFDSVIMSGLEGSYLIVDAETSSLSLSKDEKRAASWSFLIYGFELAGQIYPAARSPLPPPEGGKQKRGRECIDTEQESNCCIEK